MGRDSGEEGGKKTGPFPLTIIIVRGKKKLLGGRACRERVVYIYNNKNCSLSFFLFGHAAAQCVTEHYTSRT